MPRIEGELLIERPVEVVFDFVADERNEPYFNPRMLHRGIPQLQPGWSYKREARTCPVNWGVFGN